jgi:hypothetical protein
MSATVMAARGKDAAASGGIPYPATWGVPQEPEAFDPGPPEPIPRMRMGPLAFGLRKAQDCFLHTPSFRYWSPAEATIMLAQDPPQLAGRQLSRPEPP